MKIYLFVKQDNRSESKQLGIFFQFFEQSDALGVVFECVSTSLTDKASLGGGEKPKIDVFVFRMINLLL